ncbi:MAG: hypothetical protein RLZZ284_823 [Actinomycetota bacterium]
MSRSGPPETVLPTVDVAIIHALRQASEIAPDARRGAIAAVVAKFPTSLHAWAALGRASAPGIEAYMAFRVGYHRGLDQLRASGWRGSGFVRWQHESNRGFLECLEGLAVNAAIIGEEAEAVRCQQFLIQCDPRGRG